MTHFQIKRLIDFTATKNKFAFVFIIYLFISTCVVFNSLSNGLWSIDILYENSAPYGASKWRCHPLNIKVCLY